ncbi:hypothetical protein BC567DRAFT_228433, partial [Phyllosticta citribraziliensis]
MYMDVGSWSISSAQLSFLVLSSRVWCNYAGSSRAAMRGTRGVFRTRLLLSFRSRARGSRSVPKRDPQLCGSRM